MPREAFLINPPPPPYGYTTTPRGRGKGKSSNPLGEEALVIGALNPPFKTNSWPDNFLGHSRAAKLGWSRRRTALYSPGGRRKSTNNNPLLLLSKEEEKSMATKRRKRSRKVGAPKRRVYRRKRRNPVVSAPKRRRYRRRSAALTTTRRKRRAYRRNPVVRHTRRRHSYRRNPPAQSMAGAIDIMKPATLIMPILTGVVAKMAIEKVPTMLNLTGMTATAAQVGVMVGGGLLLPKVVGKMGATIWVAVCGTLIASNLINQYIFKTTLSGLGEIPYNVGQSDSLQLGAFPGDDMMAGLGAYPYEVQY